METISNLQSKWATINSNLLVNNNNNIYIFFKLLNKYIYNIYNNIYIFILCLF